MNLSEFFVSVEKVEKAIAGSIAKNLSYELPFADEGTISPKFCIDFKNMFLSRPDEPRSILLTLKNPSVTLYGLIKFLEEMGVTIPSSDELMWTDTTEEAIKISQDADRLFEKFG